MTSMPMNLFQRDQDHVNVTGKSTSSPKLVWNHHTCKPYVRQTIKV